MKDPEGLDERLARIRRATADIAAPPGLDRRILAAIAAREPPVRARWEADPAWSSSRHAIVVSLCACVASVVLALHLDATLITTLASASDSETDLAIGDP